MPSSANDITTTNDSAPARGRTRRWYALNDNDEWLEMLPAVPGDPFTGTGVSVFVVDAADDEDFYEQAYAGDGEMVGRLTVVDGELKVYLRDELVEYARATSDFDED